MAPTFGNGKICYIELPAIDVQQSADFYRHVFGWNIRRRGDGSTSFDDTVGEVSGSWVLDRPAAESGMIVHIMVDDAATASDAIVAAGGRIVRPIDPNAREIFAHFRDPAGNVLGIYQDRAAAKP
jgi:predicted enzyme related to lactoylglutathione lyase